MTSFRLSRTARAVALSLGVLFAAPYASASVDLVAIGKLSGSLSDLSGQTDPLENGVAGNLLGGLGSGLAWAGGSTFLAVPDRGPNAVVWYSGVDNTSSYIPRFHTLNLALSQVPDANTGLPFTLTPALQATTLLFSRSALNYGGTLVVNGQSYPAVPKLNKAKRFYFSGRSDNFDPATDSSDGKDARLDPEGIRVGRSGATVFISDEYGPYIHQFDRASGARIRSIRLPSLLAVAHKSPQGALEISGNTSGRVANKGMEGLAISPDGSTLFGFMQSALIQDGGDGAKANRILKIDIATGAVQQFAYNNFLSDTKKAYNSSEILALNSHELLVLERDGKGLGDDSTAVVKRIYKVDLDGAQDVSQLTGETALLAAAPPKTLFLDILAKLQAKGVAATQVPAKLEGMAFGEDIVVNGQTLHTLYIGNDNDFLAKSPKGLTNPNQWFVFTFSDSDLGGSTFVNQIFTP